MMPYSMNFAKKANIKIKFQKNDGLFFGHHPLVEKSPTATVLYTYIYLEFFLIISYYYIPKY